MARNGTQDINDYLDDFENAAEDYARMGPMWAELVFPDDDDALRALYGGNANDADDEDENNGRKK